MHSTSDSSRNVESSDKQRGRTEDYLIRAVSNAIDILELISQSTEPLSLVRIAEFIGQSKSSVFRILCTLEHKGLIERQPGDVYTLSIFFGFSLKSNQSLLKLKRVAEPFMRDLGKEFRETVSLAFLFENHIEVVSVVDSPQRIRMYNVVGGIIPPHASSVGKCIVAHQTEARREHLLAAYGIQPFTPHTIVEPTELDEEFGRVRQQGFGVDREESALDGCCFGAPIWTTRDHVGAALSISLPKVRLSDEAKIVESLQRTAQLVSESLSSE